MSEAKIEPGIIAPAAEEDMAVPGPDGHAEAGDTVATVKETSFDAVITRVLDASDVANKTASIAATSTEHLLMGVEELRESTAKARTHAVVVLGVTGFLMLASVGVFTLMALQLQDRLDSADATVLAVGKRVVALNSSIGALKEMEKVLEKFNERQEGQSSVIEKLMPRVDTGLAEVRKAVADLAEKSAKQTHVAVPPDPRIAALQSQLKVIESQLQAQARATAKQAELSGAMQARLLELINDQGTPPETRIIAICNRHAPDKTLEDTLRPDLFYRLGAMTIVLPPLRARGEDILTLFNGLTEQFADEYGCDAPQVTAQEAAQLLQAPWPGNVRQLVNVAERAVLQNRRGSGSIASLLMADNDSTGPTLTTEGKPLKDYVEAFERMLIDNTMRRHKGSIVAVMDELCLPRRTLNEKMAKYNLQRQDYV